ncbi:hypothetical protein MTYM_00651 [Methylococcales bacterium]|nr:hypothetical protein MTYM_00651 [Methylococcales bacterium]
MMKGILSIDLRKSNGTHLAMAVPGIKQTNRDNVKSRMSLPPNTETNDASFNRKGPVCRDCVGRQLRYEIP